MDGKLGSVKHMLQRRMVNSYKLKTNKIHCCCETSPTAFISLVLELWSQCTLQKTRDLHGSQLLCTFLTDNFNRCSVSSVSQFALTTVRLLAPKGSWASSTFQASSAFIKASYYSKNYQGLNSKTGFSFV